MFEAVRNLGDMYCGLLIMLAALMYPSSHSLLALLDINNNIKLGELLRRPELSYRALGKIDKDRPELPRGVTLTAEISVKYDGYIKRQLAQVERSAKLEEKLLPPELDYTTIPGLRLEAAEKLNEIKPANIGQASRISGVNPADISVLLIRMNNKR